ncbi:MAG: hypothetical protein E6J90_50640 [Deltaproteobacteria bacterium]|nr:MAG: hypothetical protein E6J90_50640 [Deltaproteobacteria bacterium]
MSTMQCAWHRLRLAVAFVVLLIFSFIPAVRCLLQQWLFMSRFCQRGNRDPSIDLFFDPNDWIDKLPLLAGAVVWQDPGTPQNVAGSLRYHRDWTAAERRDLYDAYWNARMDVETGVPEAPPEAAPPLGVEGTLYPRALAWKVFVAHVGHAIAADNAGWFAWRLGAMTAAQLAFLVDSRSLFHWDPIAGGTYAVRTFDQNMATPGDPVRVFRFLRDHDLIAGNSRATVARVLGWCRSNLVHFNNSLDWQAYWQYGGYPPVERVLAGTFYSHATDPPQTHWTAGCHGTGGFLKAVLRTVNIPVESLRPVVERACEHSLCRFPLDELYLSHGDDPYSNLAYSDPLPDPDRLLVDAATYGAWFGAAVADNARCDNVGRTVRDLAIADPSSLRMMRARCRDTASGAADGASQVMLELRGPHRGPYVSADLRAAGLWTRLDEAIAAHGGCAALPPE